MESVMAKRKRLTPAEPQTTDTESLSVSANTKPILPSELLSSRTRPPISQVAGDASAAAALEDLAQQMHQARTSGRLIQDVPHDQIDVSYLVRDRILENNEEMQALKKSLGMRGQQTPIELVELGPGHYGLISGWRRVAALQQLFAETNDPQFSRVLAILRRPETAADAYLAMLEENEVRVGLSYYERARIVAKAVEHGVYPNEKTALQTLFSSASRAKRSKIKSFIPVYRELDDVLRFGGAIPERLGLKLSKVFETNPKVVEQLRTRLTSDNPLSAEAEQACLVNALQAPRSTEMPSPKLVDEIIKTSDGEVRLTWSGANIVLSGKGATRLLAKRFQFWLEDIWEEKEAGGG
jgi:ParB family transcriptional regulator, chromosome partitioning protein